MDNRTSLSQERNIWLSIIVDGAVTSESGVKEAENKRLRKTSKNKSLQSVLKTFFILNVTYIGVQMYNNRVKHLQQKMKLYFYFVNTYKTIVDTYNYQRYASDGNCVNLYYM